MGYVLTAVLGERSVLARATSLLTHSRLVPLSPTIGMIPVTDALLDSLVADETASENAFPGFISLSAPLADVLASLSEQGPAAYVEADFFGGVGEQRAVAWHGSTVVLGPMERANAINQALRLLGVRRSLVMDEFDVVGMGRHRATENWLEAPDQP